jgi:hypothetical protein
MVRRDFWQFKSLLERCERKRVVLRFVFSPFPGPLICDVLVGLVVVVVVVTSMCHAIIAHEAQCSNSSIATKPNKF